MQKIVLISGQAGSGKSTCSRLLYGRLENVALIEADAIIKVKPWIEYEQLRQLAMMNGAALIRNYWNAGYEYIVCPGIVWNQEDADFLCLKIPELSKNSTLFWLHTDKDERHKRRIKRDRDNADKPDAFDAVDTIVGAAKPHSIPSGEMYEVDTTKRTPHEVTEEIHRLLMDTNS